LAGTDRGPRCIFVGRRCSPRRPWRARREKSKDIKIKIESNKEEETEIEREKENKREKKREKEREKERENKPEESERKLRGKENDACF
jgi:hypothetical protein